MSKRIFFFVVLFIGVFSGTLQAQQPSLAGVVIDQDSKEPLPGATVELSGARSYHIVTGLDGSFLIRNVPAGTYSIKVLYVGHAAYEDKITAGGKTDRVHITLAARSAGLAEVKITGRKDNSSDRYAQLADRKADIIQNSVSARTIEISPDLSVANVTQRISGISIERSTNGEGQYAIVRGMEKRYIYTLVNGIKIPSPDNKNRYVPLDIFPADLLSRLEVIKSLTPDMEGDAIGGAINMIMKDAPAKFSVQANAAAGYSEKFFTQDFTSFDHSQSASRSPRYNNGSTYQASMSDFPNSGFTYNTKHNPVATLFGLSMGGRLLHDKLGILVAGSYQNNYRNVNSVFFGTETDLNNGSSRVNSIDRRQYSIQQQRSGIHTRFDYHINSRNVINLYAGYMNLEKNEWRFASDTNLILGRVGPGTGRISNDYRTVHDIQRIFNLTLNGEHSISNHLSVNWTAAYSKASDNRPDAATLNLVTGVSKNPGTGTLVQAPLNIDAVSYREFSHNTDEDKSGYIKFTYTSKIGSIKTDWITGGMYREKNRESDYDLYNLRPSNPSIQEYDGNISHNNFSVFNGEGTSNNPLNYSATEKVGAAYAMVKASFHKLELTGGARLENTSLTWTSTVDETVKGKSGSINYYDILPDVQLKYPLGKKQTIRLSYYSAISRPNFYEVIPHVGGDPDADYKEKGNPNLKRTTAENFDLRYEYYTKGLDQVLAGLFYKRLKNPIEYALEDEGTNTYYQPDNFGNASNYGAELDITKYFRWFGIRANYTFTNSEITTTKIQRYSTGTGQSTRIVNQKRPLQGQSKHIANFSLLLKDDNKLGLNAQIAVGYTSGRINTVSQYLDNDIWQKGFVQMDFSVEKRLAKRWYLYAKVQNLLNTPYELEIKQPYSEGTATGKVPYQENGKNVFVRKDTYGSSYLLGVKFKM